MSAFAQRALIVASPPVPLFTGACPFGRLVRSGGLNFDRVFLFTRPTGACCHQNLQAAAPIAHRLLLPYLLGAAEVGRTMGLHFVTAATAPRQGNREFSVKH